MHIPLSSGDDHITVNGRRIFVERIYNEMKAKHFTRTEGEVIAAIKESGNIAEANEKKRGKAIENISGYIRKTADRLLIAEDRRYAHQNISIDSDEARGIASADIPLDLRIILKERAEIVIKAIIRLPQHYQDAIILFYIAELSHAEIAAYLDITVDNSKTRLKRAKELLSQDPDIIALCQEEA